MVGPQLHLIPDDDAIAHTATEDCVCRPGREALGAARIRGGMHAYAVVHSRLDGRTGDIADDRKG